MARRASESDHTTILIQGESGTGKEVLAKAIHYNSSRAQAPLISLNCAALPDTLLESELFGYEPGAFTDARRRKEGLIEKASGGTLFLDEIGNTSASLQAKLLRVLEEGIFNRLGGTKPIQVDVRIIAATNKILKEAVVERRVSRRPFLPAERGAAVHPAAARAPRRHSAAGPRHHAVLQQGAEEELRRLYSGRRGVAEGVSLAGQHPRTAQRDRAHHDSCPAKNEIDEDALPEEVRDYHEEPDIIDEKLSAIDVSPTGDQFVSLKELEDRYIRDVLNAMGQNKTHAARILGIHPTSLLRRLKKNSEGFQ